MPDVWEVVFSGVYYSQLWQHKMHFVQLDTFNGTAQSFCINLRENWVNIQRGMQTSSVSFTSINAKRIVGQLEQFVLPLQITGAHSPETQWITFVAGVIQKKTGVPGRAHLGRIYVPGIRGGGTQFGQLTANELTLWQAVCDDLVSEWVNPTPNGMKLVVKHPEGFTEVTTLLMRPVLGCMRSRNIGVGN
jgi:hypothetical protein